MMEWIPRASHDKPMQVRILSRSTILGGEDFQSKSRNKKRGLDTPVRAGSASEEVSRGYAPMSRQLITDTSAYPRNQ